MAEIKVYKETYQHANVYRIVLEEGDILIDPAIDFAEISNIDRIKWILITHAHYDHIRKVEEWASLNNIKSIYAHELSRELFLDPYENCSVMFMEPRVFSLAYIPISDNEIINFTDSFRAKVFHLPGHSRDSIVFFFQDLLDGEFVNRFVVSGDLLFASSIGRSDLPGSSTIDLKRSLQRFIDIYDLESVDKSLVIYPGHSIKTSLEEELKSNFYLSESFLRH